jgi:hypothetical protein
LPTTTEGAVEKATAGTWFECGDDFGEQHGQMLVADGAWGSRGRRTPAIKWVIGLPLIAMSFDHASQGGTPAYEQSVDVSAQAARRWSVRRRNSDGCRIRPLWASSQSARCRVGRLRRYFDGAWSNRVCRTVRSRRVRSRQILEMMS